MTRSEDETSIFAKMRQQRKKYCLQGNSSRCHSEIVLGRDSEMSSERTYKLFNRHTDNVGPGDNWPPAIYGPSPVSLCTHPISIMTRDTVLCIDSKMCNEYGMRIRRSTRYSHYDRERTIFCMPYWTDCC